MPPRRSNRNGDRTRATAFGRAYPNLQRALLLSCEAGPFLLIATIATGAGIWKRPMWQRAVLWRAAFWSFLSRWILVGCAITWSWNEWGRGDLAEEERQAEREASRERVQRQMRERRERDDELQRQREYQEHAQEQGQGQTQEQAQAQDAAGG